MRMIRGFKIGKRLIRISRWILRPTRTKTGYDRLRAREIPCRLKPITRLINWGCRCLTTGVKSIRCAKPRSGYMPVGHDPAHEERPAKIPKGHLAVYVGQKDGDFHRVLVPVIYVNHPLFCQLLREAEEEFGFSQQGGITIPCRFSEFEKVQTRIAAVSGSGGGKLTWKRNHF